ncbi:hypothetical protein [Ectothiorhodospira lacustris]|uniref:hypothetical protein n=1 Tax=Ectothiorhodospira lacustris TaxID=2899127 RepID=UPI001EE8BEA6|nr:hypothetical protein [Ectothiorhodospira lacustris]MCG5500756.1 hypothetical protein [Ectothiorhodospira lacustris]MCG5510892.1 hypothetical protein [Ectothiorhodospira lacustris]MCG5522562.1 hypothetical protein [Ectothiorhodospira lacustris]
MMILRRAVLPLLLALGLSGCTTVMIQPYSPEQRLQLALQRGDVVLVQGIMATLPPAEDDPERASLRVWLERAGPHLEQAMLMQAAGHLRREQWSHAQESYTRGLAVRPDSEALKTAQARALKEQQEHLQHLRVRLLLSQGRALTTLTPLYAQILRADPANDRIQEALVQAKQDTGRVAEALLQLGLSALEETDHALAVEALSLSLALAPDEAAEQALRSTQAAQSRQQALERRAHQAQLQAQWAQRNQALFSSFQGAMESSDLPAARRHLLALEQAQPRDATVRRLRRELAKAVDAEVTLGLETGRRLYLDGRIPEALETWRNLLELRPDHPELQAHVSRAERALESLRRLEPGASATSP